MAAKSVLIKVFTEWGSEPKLIIEPNWWYTPALCADKRFVCTNDTGSFFDWTADLSIEEFRELHERFRPLSLTSVYQYEAWQVIIRPKMQIIDAVLAGGVGRISHVNVRVYEWESGS